MEYGAGSTPGYRDYSLTGPEGKRAIKKGRASVQWYVPHVERKTLQRLITDNTVTLDNDGGGAGGVADSDRATGPLSRTSVRATRVVLPTCRRVKRHRDP